MQSISRIVLDVLKPQQPGVVEFAQQVANANPGSKVHLVVTEVDADTETIVLAISGKLLNLGRIEAALGNLGASLHSIDEVEVESDGDDQTV